MATRPTIPVTIRASDANYSGIGNDLDTTPTKIARSGAELALGYVPDSPLGSRPVSAQGVNYDDNVVDQWANWVSEGSAAAGIDTHIVETDSSGDINVVGVNSENVHVTANGSADGIEVTTSAGSKGVEIIRDATSGDFGLLITSPDGATGASARVTTVNSDAISVGVSQSGAGLNVAHQTGAGALFQATGFGGVIGPAIKIGSNAIEPNDLTSGTLWNKDVGGISNLKAGLDSGAGGWVRISRNATCYARSVIKTSFSLSGSPTNEVVAGDFTWKSNLVPQEISSVRVTIWGSYGVNSANSCNVKLAVRDKTAGGSPDICVIDIARDGIAGANVFDQGSATFSDVYVLPAAGARIFDLVWTGVINGSAGFFSGYVEIEELRG